MRNRFVVAYDISDPKRWRRVFQTMKSFGDAMQYSVFQCLLTRQERLELELELTELIHHDEDRILIADLGPADGRGDQAITFVGRGPHLLTPPGPTIV